MTARAADRRDHPRARLCQRVAAVLCPRAALRMAEHGFSEDDVLQTVTAPERTYPCDHVGHPPGRRTYREVYYDLYVVLDIFSRYVVGWTVAAGEDAEIPKNLLEQAMTCTAARAACTPTAAPP